MADDFQDYVYKEISHRDVPRQGSVIKNGNVQISGLTKISIEEEARDGVKIILKKDQNDNIKEIKFVCSCGETKSVVLDYSDDQDAQG